jgi:RNA polymerase sigma factor (sigma-70 family)
VSGTPGDILLQALDPDPAQAEIKLASIRTLLVRYFEFNRLRDPEDLVQEVICRVMKSLCEGQKITAKKPQSYFYGFAANILKEQRKAYRRQTLPMNEGRSEHRSDSQSSRHLHSIEARVFLDECGQYLEQQERELLVSYYVEGREKLSKRLGVNLPNLTLQIHRIKRKIREHVK